MAMVEKRVQVPEDVDVTFEESVVTVKGPKAEIKKTMKYPGVMLRHDGSEIVIEADNPKKRQWAIIGTYAAHIRNMIKGVSSGFEYKMKVIYSHFPMTIKVEQSAISVENYLGEKVPRIKKVV